MNWLGTLKADSPRPTAAVGGASFYDKSATLMQLDACRHWSLAVCCIPGAKKRQKESKAQTAQLANLQRSVPFDEEASPESETSLEPICHRQRNTCTLPSFYLLRPAPEASCFVPSHASCRLRCTLFGCDAISLPVFLAKYPGGRPCGRDLPQRHRKEEERHVAGVWIICTTRVWSTGLEGLCLC